LKSAPKQLTQQEKTFSELDLVGKANEARTHC